MAVTSAWALQRALDWRRPWHLSDSVVILDVRSRCLLTGQVDNWLLDLKTANIVASRKRWYRRADALSLVAALVKPQVMWLLPLAPLRPALTGGRSSQNLVCTAVRLLAATGVLHLSLLAQWWVSLGRLSASSASIRPDLAGLLGVLRVCAPVAALIPRSGIRRLPSSSLPGGRLCPSQLDPPQCRSIGGSRTGPG